MKFLRRDFLKFSGKAFFAGLSPAFLSFCSNPENNEKTGSVAAPSPDETGAKNSTSTSEDLSLENIRESFSLDPDLIHMSCLLLASHPKPVREAIEQYRTGLNDNPVQYVQEHFSSLPMDIRREAARYMNVRSNEIAITDSTTMGTALLINGVHIRSDQEMLTADYDYHSTHKSLNFKSTRTGASVRKIPLYRDIHSVTEDEIVDNYISEIKPETRLVTGTWVHSSTGLKIPVQKIAERIKEINRNRDSQDRVLFFIDGVHGFGVESTPVGDLGCDYFSAGTHKWMFAPRGTGILWGRTSAHGHVTPTIPTFTNGAGWGGDMTPGGFKPFEHQWAMAEAFRLHQNLGKEKVQKHIHQLARQLKEGLSGMSHVILYTPMEESLSSGIVCFDIKGVNQRTVVDRLARENIVASDTPYVPSYVRLTPGIYNTAGEVEEVLRVIRGMG